MPPERTIQERAVPATRGHVVGAEDPERETSKLGSDVAGPSGDGARSSDQSSPAARP